MCLLKPASSHSMSARTIMSYSRINGVSTTSRSKFKSRIRK